jgi:hypothetical protein
MPKVKCESAEDCMYGRNGYCYAKEVELTDGELLTQDFVCETMRLYPARTETR